MSHPIDIEKLRAFASRVVEHLGYELCDLEWKHEAGRWVLRLFIDRAAVEGTPAPVDPAAAVSHEDCSRVSRSLSAELDVEDPIGVAYTLEVSSPGLNRALRGERDFKRFIGQEARVRTRHPIGQPSGEAGGEKPTRRNFRGLLKEVSGGQVTIEVDGQDYRFPVDDVEKANLEYRF